MLGQLQVLYPTYHQYYVLATDPVPLSSEDEKVELSQLASSTLDFISAISRSTKAKNWLNETAVNELVGDVFKWTVMTADEVCRNSVLLQQYTE
jgi:importin-9